MLEILENVTTMFTKIHVLACWWLWMKNFHPDHIRADLPKMSWWNRNTQIKVCSSSQWLCACEWPCSLTVSWKGWHGTESRQSKRNEIGVYWKERALGTASSWYELLEFCSNSSAPPFVPQCCPHSYMVSEILKKKSKQKSGGEK